MRYESLSKEIIGAAMTVLNELKPGLDEKLYENALVILLHEKGINVEQQKQYPVYFHNHKIGTLIPDLIVGDQIIVDTKVVTEFNQSHMAQMIGYLSITELEVALLLNFKHSQLKWKRIVK